MPIFHDFLEHPARTSNSDYDQTTGEVTEPRYTGRREGNGLAEMLASNNNTASIPRSDVVAITVNGGIQPTLSRGELIERLKRGESPTWTGHQNLAKHAQDRTSPRPATPRHKPTSPLLPALELRESMIDNAPTGNEHAKLGLEIERPRSALHSGDFRQENDSPKSDNSAANGPLATSPIAPWHHDFPVPGFGRFQDTRESYPYERNVTHTNPSSRAHATSHASLSSSFVLVPPTSPLVQQVNNPDLDFRPRSRQGSRSPERASRRHTFSPRSLQTYQYSFPERSPSQPRSPGLSIPTLRREGTYAYQAHQPRRSLSNFANSHSSSTPQTPLLRPRRPSISSDASPLHHAPMVGSYEESILRGRMSTTPSRPLNFIAQIGVLGKGQCKANLRCPPHVTIPFPAVFYSYGTGNGRIADNQPSPYVGLVDLENSLAPAENSCEGRRRRRLNATGSDNDDHEVRNSGSDTQTNAQRRKREKMKRRSASPKAPPGGSYRIPQQGQLQIVIKNPNKTAVKLFLVPYNLSDMEPGQKTFIRQRSYSAGPIIDMPLSSRKNLGTDRPEAALSTSDDPNDRPILRYLIHLHICCPSKGRYFLYKSIRVVFANRVPDGKEKLRNEIQLPDPKYSAYKPTRAMTTPTPTSTLTTHTSVAAEKIAQEKAFRRRSTGFALMRPSSSVDVVPCPFSTSADGTANGSSTIADSYDFSSAPIPTPTHPRPIQPIPFPLSRLEPLESRPTSRDQMDVDIEFETDNSPVKGRVSPASDLASPGGLPSSRGARSPTPFVEFGQYDKRQKGDVGFGGFGSTGSPPAAGLLARRLRGLWMEKNASLDEGKDGSGAKDRDSLREGRGAP